MAIIIEYLIVTAAFWFVATRMEGIEMKRSSTVFTASAVYIISYIALKTLFVVALKALTLGLMFGTGLISAILAALAAMYLVTKVVEDFKIDSFGTLAAAVLVISVIISVLRVIVLFF